MSLHFLAALIALVIRVADRVPYIVCAPWIANVEGGVIRLLADPAARHVDTTNIFYVATATGSECRHERGSEQ
jgi:hypothetical protein